MIFIVQYLQTLEFLMSLKILVSKNCLGDVVRSLISSDLKISNEPEILVLENCLGDVVRSLISSDLKISNEPENVSLGKRSGICSGFYYSGLKISNELENINLEKYLGLVKVPPGVFYIGDYHWGGEIYQL